MDSKQTINFSFLNGKIKIVIIDTATDEQVYQTSFKCNTCKHFRDCKSDGMAQCKFATYLTARIPGTQYNLKHAGPIVEIRANKPTNEEIARKIALVDRGKRLRLAGAMKANFRPNIIREHIANELDKKR